MLLFKHELKNEKTGPCEPREPSRPLHAARARSPLPGAMHAEAGAKEPVRTWPGGRLGDRGRARRFSSRSGERGSARAARSEDVRTSSARRHVAASSLARVRRTRWPPRGEHRASGRAWRERAGRRDGRPKGQMRADQSIGQAIAAARLPIIRAAAPRMRTPSLAWSAERVMVPLSSRIGTRALASPVSGMRAGQVGDRGCGLLPGRRGRTRRRPG